MPLYQCQPPTGYKDTADAWDEHGRARQPHELRAGAQPPAAGRGFVVHARRAACA